MQTWLSILVGVVAGVHAPVLPSVASPSVASPAVASLLPAFPLADDTDPVPVRWERIPGGAFENCADNFERAGFSASEANRLAHIALFGVEPTVGEAGCDYYVVKTYYCDGLTRRYTRTHVGTVCIEQFLTSCPLMTCPPNQGVFFRLTTAAHCTPPSTCVWVEISGPLTSGQASVCDALVNCDCWPGLACALRECVPITGTAGHPTDCPNCP